MTLRESSAHFMRVAEMSMPEEVQDERPVELDAARRRAMPTSSSEAIEADACEIAQPWPSKRTSSTVAVLVDLAA